MMLPNAHLALVGAEKITEYLLNPAHPDNGGKAQFFSDLGFQREHGETLAAAFRKLALTAPVAKSLESSHGRKYIVDGEIETLCGKTPVVRSIWIIVRGLNCPRLVTAYPREQRVKL